jgi:hypothetical protein
VVLQLLVVQVVRLLGKIVMRQRETAVVVLVVLTGLAAWLLPHLVRAEMVLSSFVIRLPPPTT